MAKLNFPALGAELSVPTRNSSGSLPLSCSSRRDRVGFRPTSKFVLRYWPSVLREVVIRQTCPQSQLRCPSGPTSSLTEHPHCWRKTSPRGSCVPARACGIHDNSSPSFMRRDVDSCKALCADVVLSSSATRSKGILCMCRGSSLHVAVYLSESSSTNSPDKLSMPQPGGYFTTGDLSIEH